MQYDLLAKRKKANRKSRGRKKAPQFNNVVVFLHAENSENVAATREGHTHTAYIFMTLPVSASSSSHSRSTGNNKKKQKAARTTINTKSNVIPFLIFISGFQKSPRNTA